MKIKVILEINYKYKWICEAHKASWSNLFIIPKNWGGRTTNPNFKTHSLVIRFLWWYFGIMGKPKES